MARVYSSRIMLDPSVLQNMNNINQQRYQNEVARRQSVLSPMRDLLNSAGNTFDTWLERKEREWELSDSENNDSQSNIKKMAENFGIDLSSATKDGDNTIINLNDDIKSKIQSYSNFIPEEYKKYIDLENNRITIPTKLLEGSNNSYMKDPIYRAARNEYIRTGNSAPLQNWRSGMSLDAARKDAEQKQKIDEQRTLYNTALEWISGVEDSKTKGGITSVGNISSKDVAIARNKIRAAKYAGVDTSLLEEKLDEILEIQTPESNVNTDTPNTQLSTEVQNKMTEDKLKGFKDRGAKLENVLKTLNRKSKEDVDAYNAEIDALQAEIDAANMTNDVKLPSKVKQITKPSLSEANKGYKEGKYTASQMDAFGYGKYYDDDTDSYHN